MSSLAAMMPNQRLWALWRCRLAHGLYRLSPCVLWQKLIEVFTGIELPDRASIAPGLYLRHFGKISVHPDAVIGPGCNISQGVTIAVSGRGVRRGVPIPGECACVGANAVISDRLTVGDEAVIAANALGTQDVSQCRSNRATLRKRPTLTAPAPI